MKNFSRRDFLKSGLLASGTLFLSFTPFEKVFSKNTSAQDDPLISSTNETDISKLRKQAKEYFYSKEYLKSEQCYRQLLVLFPSDITIYDGLAKTLNAQNRSLAAAESYRQGWLDQKKDPQFSDRMARSIGRLLTGNHKHEKEFCNRTGQNKLFEVAAQLYIDCIENSTEAPKEFLLFGLLDLKKKLNKYNQSATYTGNPAVSFSEKQKKQIQELTQTAKEKWKTTRNKKKKDFDPLNEEDANKRDLRSTNKTRRNLKFEKEKESREKEQKKFKKRLYYSLFLTAIKRKSTTDAEKYLKRIDLSTIQDKNATGLLIHHYRKQKQYKELVNFQKDKYTKDPNFWNTISYANSLRLQSKKEDKSNLCSRALELYESFKDNEDLTNYEYIQVYGGILNCYLQQKKYKLLQETVIETTSRFPLSCLTFTLVYIKSWIKEKKYNEAEAAYNLLLNGTDSTIINTDPIYVQLQKLHNVITQSTGEKDEVPGYGIKKESLFNIYYGMYTLYDKKNDNIAKQNILNNIIRIEPENKFVKKRQNLT